MNTTRKPPLPIWLRAYFQIAMIGAIDPSVRKIVVSFSEDRELLVRYYMEREPDEDDYEALELLQVEVDAMTSKEQALKSSEGEIIVTTEPLNLLDSLDGVIYTRMEKK